MKKSREENTFLNIILLFISFIFDFFRSILLLFGFKSNNIENNLFFDFLNFIFKIWPKNFWKKPSLYRFFSFLGDLFDYLILRYANKKK